MLTTDGNIVVSASALCSSDRVLRAKDYPVLSSEEQKSLKYLDGSVFVASAQTYSTSYLFAIDSFETNEYQRSRHGVAR